MKYNDAAYDVVKREFANTDLEFKSRLLYLCESLLIERIEKSKINGIGTREGNHSSNILFQRLVDSFYYLWGLLYRIRYAFDAKKKLAYIHYLEGCKKYLLEDSKTSIEELNKALHILPDFKLAQEQLIELYFENRNYARLIELVDRVRLLKGPDYEPKKTRSMGKNDSLNSSMRIMIGIAYYNLGEYDKSIDNLRFAIEAGLKDYKAFYYMGLCHLELKDSEGAKPWFREASNGIETKFFRERLEELRRVYVNQNLI